MKHTRRAGLVAAVVLAGLVPVVGIGGAGAAPSDAPTANEPTQDTSTALVVLTGDPVTTAKNVSRGNGNRVNLNGAATKSYRATLSAGRNAFKKWLQTNAPRARVTGEFDLSVNAVSVQLNGTSLATLRRAPMVTNAQFSGLYRKTDAVDPDLALINALAGWGAGGAAGAGAGVEVAIIDSGIQQDHPCFDDMGDSDGPNNLTNDKVIVAKVFYNKAKVQGLDASAIDSHGTHVAGTVACDVGTTAVVEGVTIPHTISGVAPAARLGNYNVFPGTVANARSEDILNALEAAYADGMDVANMSLGGDAHGIQDLLTIAVDNLDRGGMVVAVSAGNEGPGPRTTGSPGTAERALTAGASSVPHQVVSSISTAAGSADVVVGEFGAVPVGQSRDLVVIPDPANVDVPGVSLACSPLTQTGASSQVAVIARGTCDFTVKVRNVQAAGFGGAIVVNRVAGEAFVMGGNGEPNQPTIPAVMIALDDRAVVTTAPSVTFNAPAYRNPYGLANVMADFSSEGPTDVDLRIKPDVVAPGVNVLSSVPGDGFAFFNGTSMAAPHLAGAAAVVRGQHPTWTAAQVRSAIVNSADRDALTPFFDNEADDPNLIGTGLLDLDRAVDASVLVDPVSVSFGAVTSGAGKTNVKTATVTSLSGPLTVSVVDPHGSATFTASLSGTTLTVTQSSAKGAAAGPSWATVVFSRGGVEVASMRVFAQVV